MEPSRAGGLVNRVSEAAQLARKRNEMDAERSKLSAPAKKSRSGAQKEKKVQ